MGKAIKTRVRDFFKSKFDSDASVEFLRMFLMPFAAQCQGRGLSVDRVLELFFHTETRDIFHAKAFNSFQLPGRQLWGSPPTPAERSIARGQILLVVLDEKSRTAKIEIVHKRNPKNFILEHYEYEAIKTHLRRLPDKSGYRDVGFRSLEG
jgi:hypothetical protein